MSKAFSYDLPESVIAQRPVQPYDAAKLLVVCTEGGVLEESTFTELGRFFSPADLLVFNDTKVIPARFLGRNEKSGGSVELLLLSEVAPLTWECIGKPLKRFKQGARYRFSPKLYAVVEQKVSSERVWMRFACDEGEDVQTLMRQIGTMPIPPYIRAGQGDERDRTDYQTMFARVDGSIAAPTASLHFTPRLLESLAARGVATEFVTLHVGAASFLPLFHEDQVEARKPGVELYCYSSRVLKRIEETRSGGGRVVAVGTTVVRALESMIGASSVADGTLLPTELFITPGYTFRAIDWMITNFHQPATTHLLLVEAFMGKELLGRSYEYALTHQFRFLSYGDGMLIVPAKTAH